MTVSEFFGNAFLAFGPPLAMFTLTIAKDPILVIIMFGSAFFWYVSLLTSSILWLIFTPLPIPECVKLVMSLIFSVLCQEYFRYLSYKTLMKAENALKRVTDEHSQVSNRHVLAYTSGLGFGVMSGIFSLVNVLADAVGPGTMGLRLGNDNFFVISAILTHTFILMHVFWSVILSSAIDQGNTINVAFVVVSHLAASLSTLSSLAQLQIVGVLICFIIAIVSAAKAFLAAGGSSQSFIRSFQCTNVN